MWRCSSDHLCVSGIIMFGFLWHRCLCFRYHSLQFQQELMHFSNGLLYHCLFKQSINQAITYYDQVISSLSVRLKKRKRKITLLAVNPPQHTTVHHKLHLGKTFFDCYSLTRAESNLNTLATCYPCLKTQRIMGNDRQDSGSFYNPGMWSQPLVRVPFYCFLFQNHTWISATHLTGAHYNDQCHLFPFLLWPRGCEPCWTGFDTKPVKTSELFGGYESTPESKRPEIQGDSSSLQKPGAGAAVHAHPHHHSCYSRAAFAC